MQGTFIIFELCKDFPIFPCTFSVLSTYYLKNKVNFFTYYFSFRVAIKAKFQYPCKSAALRITILVLFIKCNTVVE